MLGTLKNERRGRNECGPPSEGCREPIFYVNWSLSAAFAEANNFKSLDAHKTLRAVFINARSRPSINTKISSSLKSAVCMQAPALHEQRHT